MSSNYTIDTELIRSTIKNVGIVVGEIKESLETVYKRFESAGSNYKPLASTAEQLGGFVDQLTALEAIVNDCLRETTKYADAIDDNNVDIVIDES